MTGYLLWFLYFIGSAVVLNAAEIPLRKSNRRLARIIVFVVKLLLMAVCSAAIMVFDFTFTWRNAMLIGGAHIALVGDLAADVIMGIYALILHFSRMKNDQAVKLQLTPGRRVWISICFSIFFGIAYQIYGTVNMQVVTRNEYTVTSEKLSEEYDFVFLSDTHTGTSQSLTTFEHTIEKVAAEKPDFVILGGDVTDELTTKDEMEETYRIIGEKLDCPVYFIYGNHDCQDNGERIFGGTAYSVEELEAAITANGITIVKDQYLELADDLVLLGRDDLSHKETRADISELTNPNPAAFCLVIDHQPDKAETAADGGDLQVSGHTHSGQVFPLRTLNKWLGNYTVDEYDLGDKELIVSPGEAGWGIPFRTESHCAYEVIQLMPEN